MNGNLKQGEPGIHSRVLPVPLSLNTELLKAAARQRERGQKRALESRLVSFYTKKNPFSLSAPPLSMFLRHLDRQDG